MLITWYTCAQHTHTYTHAHTHTLTPRESPRSDIVLIEDAAFKKYVDVYAKDQKAFFNDFAKAFQKLEELGTSNLYPV